MTNDKPWPEIRMTSDNAHKKHSRYEWSMISHGSRYEYCARDYLWKGRRWDHTVQTESTGRPIARRILERKMHLNWSTNRWWHVCFSLTNLERNRIRSAQTVQPRIPCRTGLVRPLRVKEGYRVVVSWTNTEITGEIWSERGTLVASRALMAQRHAMLLSYSPLG